MKNLMKLIFYRRKGNYGSPFFMLLCHQNRIFSLTRQHSTTAAFTLRNRRAESQVYHSPRKFFDYNFIVFFCSHFAFRALRGGKKRRKLNYTPQIFMVFGSIHQAKLFSVNEKLFLLPPPLLTLKILTFFSSDFVILSLPMNS